MKKMKSRSFRILMAAVISAAMLCPQVKVSAADGLVSKAATSYFPSKTVMKKTARKTEPEEWNQKEIKAYKFGTLEDALYYALTGGIKYYDQNYFKNPDLIKLTPVESGALGLAVVGDNKQEAILYDSNKKIIKKLPLSYVKAQVNAGETYYIEFPKNCKEGLITAYVLQNECGGLAKNDLNMQKGEEKETYHTFKMTKRGFAGFVVASMVEDGGNTSYKVQKNEKGKWITIGRTKSFKPTNEDETQIAVGYGLSKGNYRLVLKAPKEQLNTMLYTTKNYAKKKVAYKKSKAKNLNATEMYTMNEKAARWYKVSVKSSKKQSKLKILTVADQGGFKFTIYERGKKKPVKTVKTSAKHLEKTVKLPKKKGMYYVKVSKRTKKTNGYYEIKK